SATRRCRSSSKRPAPRGERLMADAVVRHVVTFGRVLREAGLEVGPGRLNDALVGLDRVDLTRQDDVYWTLRQTLVSRHDDLEAFDRAFRAWFLRAPTAPLSREQSGGQTIQLVRRSDGTKRSSEQGDGEGDQEALGYSREELLREKDFASLTPDEFAIVG